MSTTFPEVTLPEEGSGVAPTLGHRLVDNYLESVWARLRPNSTLAVVYDLKVFFIVIELDPVEVRRRDVLEFIRAQRTGSGDRNVVAIGESGGLALSTIRRRLSSVAGFYSHLVALGEMDHNPVQRGMPVRRLPATAVSFRWFDRFGICPRSSTTTTSSLLSVRCAGTGIGR